MKTIKFRKRLRYDIGKKMPHTLKLVKTIMNKTEDLFVSQEYVDKKMQEGKEILENLTKDKETLYLICGTNIGDMVIISSFCKLVKERYGLSRIILVLYEHQKYIPLLFSYLDGYIVFPEKNIRKMEYYIKRSGIYSGDNWKCCLFPETMSRKGKTNYYTIKWDSKKDFSMRYKESILGIDLNTAPELINLPEDKKLVDTLIKKYKFNNKSIILFPKANSELLLRDICWKKIVKELKNRGYKVYTNIGKNEKPIEGTKPFDGNLKELIYIVPKIKCFISVRSGICEYLALNSPRMIVINNSKNNIYGWDDVNIFSQDKNITNVCSRGKSINKFVKEIINIVEERYK